MKKMMSLLLAALLVVFLPSCGTQKQKNSTKTESGSKNAKLQFALGTSLTKEDSFKGDGDVVLLTEKYELPQLELHNADGTVCDLDSEFKDDADKQMAKICRTFNDEMKSVAEKFETSVSKQLNTAANAYNDLDENSKSGWVNYAEELTIENSYLTDGILSVLCKSYSAAGGVHPNSGSSTWNFDLKSGEFIDFDSLAGDDNSFGDSLTTALTASIYDQINTKGLAESYFDNYSSTLQDLKNNAVFYFDKDGMNVRFDTYVLAPYAAGPQTFAIPYNRFFYALSTHIQSLFELSQNDGVVSDYYAAQTLWKWFNMSMPPIDRSAKATVEGVERYKAALGNIKTINDLRELLCRYVSEEIADKWLDSGKFAESDGALYVSEGERGGDITVGTMDFSVKIDGESGSLTQTVHRQTYDSSKKQAVLSGETDEYVYPFVLKNGHAVFSDFPCPL